MNFASIELSSVDVLDEMLTLPIGGISAWDFQITQLERGRFFGDYKAGVLAGAESTIVGADDKGSGSSSNPTELQVVNPTVYAAHHKYGRLVSLRGCPPLDYFGFLIPLQSRPLISFRGQPLEPGQVVMVTNVGQEMEFTTQPGAEFLSLRVGQIRRTQMQKILLSDRKGFHTGITTHDPREVARLERRVFRLIYEQWDLNDPKSLAKSLNLEAEILGIAGLMFDVFGEESVNLNRERCRSTARLVRDYLEANLDRAVNVADACSFLELKPRTFHYAFKHCFGISPVQYHRYRRLHMVRDKLVRSRPGDTTVTELATELSFFHLGRFSSDYRAVFGERPSQTLAAMA